MLNEYVENEPSTKREAKRKMEHGSKSFSALTEINEFLNHDYTPWGAVGEQSFFVHADIIDRFAKKLNEHKIAVNNGNVWPFHIKIGTENGEKDSLWQSMYLVWLKHETQEQADFLFNFFVSSIYSFPWEDSQTKLYLQDEQFNFIE